MLMSRFALTVSCVGISLLINLWTSGWLYGVERQFELKAEKFLDKFLQKSHHWNDEYVVIANVWKRKFSEAKEDITLVTQCSVNNLHYLIKMAHRWGGPMSVAIFTPGTDFIKAILGSYWLTKCFPKAFQQTSFHFAFPSSHAPTNTLYISSLELSEFLSRDQNYCPSALTKLRGLRGSNYRLKGIQYPHNTLRNIALEWVRTRYLLVLDVDTFPSIDVRQTFMHHISSSNHGTQLRRAYILPAFEAKSGVQIPRTKSDLIQLYRRDDVRAFHLETCPYCHRNEKLDEWIAIPQSNETLVGYEIAWEQSFEPFFISERDVIRYDERFKQYGFDRISQTCELHVSGYRFFVVNNAFVCHDGFKRRKDFHPTKEIENLRNFKIYTNEFIPELSRKYPKSTRSCKHTGNRVGRAKTKFLPHSRN